MAYDYEGALAAGIPKEEIDEYLRSKGGEFANVASGSSSVAPPTPTPATQTPPAAPGPTSAPPYTPLPQVPPEYAEGGAKAIVPGQNPAKVGPELTKETMKQTLAADADWAQRNFAAFGGAAVQAVQSIAQQLGRPPTEQELTEWRAIAEASPVGDIAGNIAMFAMPGAKLAKGAGAVASMLPKAMKVQQVARGAIAPALAGGEEYLFNPIDKPGETRAENAGWGALFGKGAEYVGQGAARVGKGLVRPTEQALEFIKRDIIPTVSQAGRGAMGALVGGAEDLTRRVLPKSWMAGMGRAENETMEHVAGRAQPIPVGETLPARGAFPKATQLQFDTAYDAELVGKHIPLPRGLRTQANTASQAKLAGLEPGEKKAFQDDVDAVLGQIPLRGRADGTVWKQALTDVRERIRVETADGTQDALRRMRAWKEVEAQLLAARNAKLTPVEQARLDRLDDQWGHFKLLEHAGAKPSATPESTGLKNLIQAVEEKTPTGVKVNTEGRYQDVTEPAKTVFKETLKKGEQGEIPQWVQQTANWGIRGGLVGAGATNPLLAALAAPIAGVGKLADTRGGARFLMGDLEKQKQLAKLLKDYPEFMRALAAGAGASYEKKD